MQVEIMMIGTELLLGQIQDTNATYMAQVMAAHGINLFQKTTVGDNPARIKAALDASLERADVILCSGGLGPTEDDITRECIAELLERPLEYHAGLFEAILARFAHAGLKITENNKKQAMLPQGATAIPNPNGTAPGIILEHPRGIIICMPGVPGELKPMLEDQVIPYLRERFGLSGVLHYRILKVCGMGESRVDSLLGDLINASSNPTIGLLASPDAVRIRITAHAADVAAAEALIDPVDAAVCERLPGLVMGRDDETLETVVDQLLCARGWTLALAETHTGGMVAQRLSAAQSRAFAGGRVFPGSAEGEAAREKAIDLAARSLLDFPATCALALVADPLARRSVAVFETPLGRQEWEVGFLGTGAQNQLRTSIMSLEQIRRYLIGAAGNGS